MRDGTDAFADLIQPLYGCALLMMCVGLPVPVSHSSALSSSVSVYLYIDVEQWSQTERATHRQVRVALLGLPGLGRKRRLCGIENLATAT